MSQKKVDAYKKEKANRSQAIKKEKMMLKIQKAAVAVVCLGIVCWVGFSIYGKYEDAQEAIVVETEMNTTALDNYLNEMYSEAE